MPVKATQLCLHFGFYDLLPVLYFATRALSGRLFCSIHLYVSPPLRVVLEPAVSSISCHKFLVLMSCATR